MNALCVVFAAVALAGGGRKKEFVTLSGYEYRDPGYANGNAILQDDCLGINSSSFIQADVANNNNNAQKECFTCKQSWPAEFKVCPMCPGTVIHSLLSFKQSLQTFFSSKATYNN